MQYKYWLSQFAAAGQTVGICSVGPTSAVCPVDQRLTPDWGDPFFNRGLEFVTVSGSSLSTCLWRTGPKFSVGLRSGEFPGPGPNIQCFIPRATWLSRWPHGPAMFKQAVCSSADCSWKKLLWEDVLVPFFIHGCVFWQNCEGSHFLGWKAAPHTNGIRMLYCWLEAGLMVVLAFSYLDNPFCRCPKQ